MSPGDSAARRRCYAAAQKTRDTIRRTLGNMFTTCLLTAVERENESDVDER